MAAGRIGKRLTDAQLLALIRAIHAELKGAYGSPRMVGELRGRGFPAGKERVERLMRENDIRARHKRRYKATTDSKHALPVAPNVLERNFTPSAPNQVWTADLTYIWTDEGWLYLAVVLDLFNREVVGWSIKPRMTADIVIDALTMAWFRRRPAPGLIHHSDRGSQYASARVPGAADRIRHDLLDESQGQLLGQRADRELLQQPEERAGAWHPLRHARRGARPTCSSTSRCSTTAVVVTPRSAIESPIQFMQDWITSQDRAEIGGMRPYPWKTKNRGNLNQHGAGTVDAQPIERSAENNVDGLEELDRRLPGAPRSHQHAHVGIEVVLDDAVRRRLGICHLLRRDRLGVRPCRCRLTAVLPYIPHIAGRICP